MASSRNILAIGGALACILTLASAAFAQPRVTVSTTSQPRPAPAAGSDHRDVLVMLDGGPLHLRLHVALGGISLAELRRQYVASLIERMDTNKDGKLARAEAQKSPLLK